MEFYLIWRVGIGWANEDLVAFIHEGILTERMRCLRSPLPLRKNHDFPLISGIVSVSLYQFSDSSSAR